MLLMYFTNHEPSYYGLTSTSIKQLCQICAQKVFLGARPGIFSSP